MPWPKASRRLLDIVGRAGARQLDDGDADSRGLSLGEALGDSNGEALGDSNGEALGEANGDALGASLGDPLGEAGTETAGAETLGLAPG